MKTSHMLALATAAAVGSIGCGPAGGADSVETRPASVPRSSETDARIESSFKKTYIYTTYLKSEKIEIHSKNGVVSLTGSVADANHKPLAEHTAEALPGVTTVENKIQVSGDVAAANSDAWIRSKVMSALLFHRNVSAGKTEIAVKDGAVTLRGEASSEAQKELTTEYAKDVEGVKDVKNEMTVGAAKSAEPGKTGQTMSEAIDDASITAQVKMSLLVHRSTSALKTKVSTKDGVVTLGGDSKNGAERDLVTKLVTDINGVKSVVNNMTVDKAVSSNK